MDGITLIALIVTIIVLLILAGITIDTVFNENGIIRKVQEAIDMTKKHTDEEQEKIDEITKKEDGGTGGPCNMAINVVLDSYNSSLGSFPVVFQVTAVSEGKRIYNDVVSIKFEQPGEQSLDLLGMGPEGTTVTVTQLYAGKNYKLLSDSTVTLTLSSNKKEKASFKQTYDGGLISGNYQSAKLIYNKDNGSYKLENNS